MTAQLVCTALLVQTQPLPPLAIKVNIVLLAQWKKSLVQLALTPTQLVNPLVKLALQVTTALSSTL